MATHSKDAVELPYVFFISKILVCFGVNFSNKDPVEMGNCMIFVKVCNINMGVKYDFKNKIITYIDEVVQAYPPPVPQPTNQEQPSNQYIFDYMTYMNTCMNEKFSYLYSHMNILPYQVRPYHYPHFQPQENQGNMNQANQEHLNQENLNQDNFNNQDFMNHDQF